MYIERSRHPRLEEAEEHAPGSPATGIAPSNIVIHQAVAEDGGIVRVASITPRYRTACDGSEVVEGMPQWFTERGEPMVLLCDSWFHVPGTERKLRVVASWFPGSQSMPAWPSTDQ